MTPDGMLAFCTVMGNKTLIKLVSDVGGERTTVPLFSNAFCISPVPLCLLQVKTHLSLQKASVFLAVLGWHDMVGHGYTYTHIFFVITSLH